MLSRRALVGRLAAGTAALWGAGAARLALAAPVPSRPTGSDIPQAKDLEVAKAAALPEPWELLAPLVVGASVTPGWRIAGLTPIIDGACVVTLQNDRGRSERIHLCRNDGRPQGLVYTSRFDLLVMNGGKGDLPTQEGFAQAVGELSHIIARNEQTTAQPEAFLPHSERLQRFADASCGKLL